MKISDQVKDILKKHNIDNLDLVIDLTEFIWDEKIKEQNEVYEDQRMKSINANLKKVEKLMGVENE
jgi:hypothetical protein